MMRRQLKKQGIDLESEHMNEQRNAMQHVSDVTKREDENSNGSGFECDGALLQFLEPEQK